MFQKKCLYCDGSFTTQHSTGKFCSKLCFQKSEKGRPGTNLYWLGKKRDESTKLKISISRKGIPAWNKGKTGYKTVPCSEEKKRKISLAQIGRTGLRKANSGSFKKGLVGPLSPAWRGGYIPINKSIRLSHKYKDEWQRPILKRDNRTCQICFTTEGLMDVDHIRSLAIIIHENNIRTMKEAYAFAEIWDTNNGRVLCKNCHKQTDNFSGKVNKLTRAQSSLEQRLG